tara:strand:+ start:645 stop:842 length:198 start_codon:yes stop_codon:yes gene_type:complete
MERTSKIKTKMSRSKEDKEASLKWWANISEEKQKEISIEYFYSLKEIELSNAEIEIVWRRELKKD